MSASLTHKQAFEQQFITEEQLREQAPSVFTTKLAKRVGNRYLYIFTPEVIKDLESIGWKPVNAYEVRPKRADNKGFQKHFIRLRNPDKYIGSENKIVIIPELLVVNSYDARSSFKFYIVLYRVSCDNGVIVKSNELEVIRVPHKGDAYLEYTELQEQLLRNMDIAIDLMNRMSTIHLTPDQQRVLAKECYRARWDYKYPALQPRVLLERLRPEDEYNDLWTVLNVIQEKLIRGGWIGSGGRTIKAMRDRNRELNINTRLFQIVDNFFTQIQKQK
jgi:hypothetical protein